MRAQNEEMHLNQELDVSQKWFLNDDRKPSMLAFKRKPKMIPTSGTFIAVLGSTKNFKFGIISVVPRTILNLEVLIHKQLIE